MDLAAAKDHVLKVAKNLISEDFEFSSREKMYVDFIKYSLGIAGSYDLNKGVILFGSVGTGKTSVMRIMQRAFHKKPFKIASARHVARDCVASDKPMKIIDDYGRHSYRRTQYGHVDYKSPINVCFDDLGAELSSIKHYGNIFPVMEDIIQDRYIEFIERGLITHFTTNMNAKMIEEIYGKRTIDRIVQMCNAVNMDGDSLRR